MYIQEKVSILIKIKKKVSMNLMMRKRTMKVRRKMKIGNLKEKKKGGN